MARSGRRRSSHCGILLSEAPDLPWGAAFHCQQALEKMTNGVLIAKRVEPPKTHDIDALGRLVGSREPDIPSETDLLAAFAKLRELRLQIDKLAPAPSE